MQTPRWLKNVFTFYRDGFKNMTVGKTLWAIVIIKLFIMFVVLKVFFFPNFLNSKFATDREKAEFVSSELIDRSTVNPSNFDKDN
ncbi:MAG: DUF4492 domain-containing protein [Bacteroidales bacterium]|nr:DUF4492 domain-containing protein [Bacteroidales bacterium]